MRSPRFALIRLLATGALLLLLASVGLGVAPPARAGTGTPSAKAIASSWTAPTLSTAQSVAVGESLHLAGSDYPPGSRVDLVLLGGTPEDSFRGVLPSVLPDPAGHLDVDVAVPSDAVPGNAVLYATSTDARARGRSAMVRLRIVPEVPLLLRYWWALALGALVLLLVGGVLLVARSRRRAGGSSAPSSSAGTAGAA